MPSKCFIIVRLNRSYLKKGITMNAKNAANAATEQFGYKHELLAYACTPGIAKTFLSEVLTSAIKLDDAEVLTAIARHANLSLKDRLILVTSTHASVRAACVASHMLDINFVYSMLSDSSDQVLFEIARYPGINESTLKYLASHSNAIVRQGVCENQDVSVGLIRTLCLDAVDTVSVAAQERAEEFGIRTGKSSVTPSPSLVTITTENIGALLQGTTADQLVLCRLTPLPPNVRAALFSSQSEVVIACAASRSDITTSEASACVSSTFETVRLAVVSNAQCPLSIAGAGLTDSAESVRAALAFRATDPVMIDLLLKDTLLVKKSLAQRVETLSLDQVIELSKVYNSTIHRQIAINCVNPKRLGCLQVNDLIKWKVEFVDYLKQLISTSAGHLDSNHIDSQLNKLIPVWTTTVANLATVVAITG